MFTIEIEDVREDIYSNSKTTVRPKGIEFLPCT